MGVDGREAHDGFMRMWLVWWFLVGEMANPRLFLREPGSQGRPVRAGARFYSHVRAPSLGSADHHTLQVIKFHPRNHVWANARPGFGPAAFGVPCLCRYIAEATRWRLGSVREALPVMTSATQYDLVSAIF